VLRRHAQRLLRTEDALVPAVVRIVAGAVFVSFSFGKFLNHAAEAAAFDRYGIPAPDETTYVVGALEMLGGVALILGLGTRVVAIALGLNMIGAITTAGRIEGGPVHLGLAPALLIAMVYLVWTGAGARSVDRRLEARLRRS